MMTSPPPPPLPLSASVAPSEKGGVEKRLSRLQHEADSRCAELEALRDSSLELQRQRDLLREQREDLEKQLARQRTEAQRGYRRMAVTRHTSRHPRLFSSTVCLQFRSVTHVILRPAMHPDDIGRKM